jgi:methionine synthase II (cobalamin-independent)
VIPAGRAEERPPAQARSRSATRPAPLADIDNLKAALTGVDAAGAFLSAASPGVISLFFRNDHYTSQEAYLFAIAEAMRGEYEAIAAAGVTLQVDCPDLAMGRHIQYADLSVEEFRKRARLHVEALNHALAAIPPERVRMHLCSLLADGGWYFIEDLDWQPPGEDPGEITQTKHLLREMQQYGGARVADPLGINELSGQISEILFFDSHYELQRANLLGGLAAIRKRAGAGLNG